MEQYELEDEIDKLSNALSDGDNRKYVFDSWLDEIRILCNSVVRKIDVYKMKKGDE